MMSLHIVRVERFVGIAVVEAFAACYVIDDMRHPCVHLDQIHLNENKCMILFYLESWMARVEVRALAADGHVVLLEDVPF